MTRTARHVGQQIEITLKMYGHLTPQDLHEMADFIAERESRALGLDPLNEPEFARECRHWSDTWQRALEAYRSSRLTELKGAA